MLSDKLRKEILEVKKQTVEYTKMLKDEHLKKEFEEREKKTNVDIKWLYGEESHGSELLKNLFLEPQVQVSKCS